MSKLTSQQSRTARQALGLSQSKVARATGINRSTLGLFEVDRYILDDRALQGLRAFYEVQGYTFEAKAAGISPVAAPMPPPEPPVSSVETRATVMDGFAIPGGFAPEEVETVLDEIHANDAAIADIATQPVKRHWLTDEVLTEASDAAVILMARNYQLIRQLQGHIPTEAANDDGNPSTVADVVRQRLREKL